MQVSTKAIVLTSIKYGDTSLIAKIFTASDGLKSYMLKGILTSKKGKLRTSYFQPLTQLELVANHRNKGTLESIREAKVYNHYQTLHTNIQKNAMTMFLASFRLPPHRRHVSQVTPVGTPLTFCSGHTISPSVAPTPSRSTR